VLAAFIVIHILEGDIIGPRIVRQAIGLHPAVSLIALIAGAELFGIVGALFASPVAGVLQALLIAVWSEWRAAHPEQFEEDKEKLEEAIDENLPDHPVHPSEPQEKLLS
jgi:predicted PurR-regulated permease PerM